MAYITVRIKGVEGHSSERLEGGERLVVGRTSAASITIRHESISREHCAFVLEDEVWYIEDLGSANGTRVNGERISQRQLLNERDIIKIGKARLTFHAGQQRSRRDSDAVIALDSAEAGDSAAIRQVLADDPAQAMPCAHCGAWFSIAHRLPEDRINCPRCERANTVPVLVSSAAD